MHRRKHPVSLRHRPAGPRLPWASCRGRRIGVKNIVECLSVPEHHCEFLMSFGHRYYCNHPQRLQIAIRTAAAARKPGGLNRFPSAATFHTTKHKAS